MLLHASIFSLTVLLTTLTAAVKLKLQSVDSRNCPFDTDVSVFADHSGFSIKHNTSSTSLASIGPDTPSPEERKRCYIGITFEISPNRRLVFSSLELNAPAKLDADVKATVTTDFVWQLFNKEAKLSTGTLSGPHDGTWKLNRTDAEDKYQPYCRYSGPSLDDNSAPYTMEVYIQTYFALTSSNPSAQGELGKDDSAEQVLRLSYDEPCKRGYPHDVWEPAVQTCIIDRENEYYCTCPGESPESGKKACSTWERFPPNPTW